jgi:hypothetical protein
MNSRYAAASVLIVPRLTSAAGFAATNLSARSGNLSRVKPSAWSESNGLRAQVFLATGLCPSEALTSSQPRLAQGLVPHPLTTPVMGGQVEIRSRS